MSLEDKFDEALLGIFRFLNKIYKRLRKEEDEFEWEEEGAENKEDGQSAGCE